VPARLQRFLAGEDIDGLFARLHGAMFTPRYDAPRMKDYLLEISFDDPALEEIVQSRLYLTASTGSTSTDFSITAYFDSPEQRDEARAALSGIEGIEIENTERERVDWLELYEQSLEPIEIGRRFVVAPDAKLIARSERMPIVVPQEQAFGTGSHETTALCIELLESLELEGKRGLDIGTGTGILAIAMLLLGARKAIAFDNDPDAYGAMRDNRMRNRIDEARLPMFIGSAEALRGGAFDVVTMNIIPEVIIPLLPAVLPLVSGALILSGILLSRKDDVIRQTALTLHDERQRGEWWAGLFYR
jgi:ribosomal protein L11 methyltransferase